MKGLPDRAAGGNADLVLDYANERNGQTFATIPVAVFFTTDFLELDDVDSPFFDVWAHAGIAEIVSALHERLVTSA